MSSNKAPGGLFRRHSGRRLYGIPGVRRVLHTHWGAQLWRTDILLAWPGTSMVSMHSTAGGSPRQSADIAEATLGPYRRDWQPYFSILNNARLAFQNGHPYRRWWKASPSCSSREAVPLQILRAPNLAGTCATSFFLVQQAVRCCS